MDTLTLQDKYVIRAFVRGGLARELPEPVRARLLELKIINDKFEFIDEDGKLLPIDSFDREGALALMKILEL